MAVENAIDFSSGFQAIMENVMIYWIRYSGVIAIILTIIFTILYIKNKKLDKESKKTKRYKILLIISIILIIQDIALWIYMITALNQIIGIIVNNADKLII